MLGAVKNKLGYEWRRVRLYRNAVAPRTRSVSGCHQTDARDFLEEMRDRAVPTPRSTLLVVWRKPRNQMRPILHHDRAQLVGDHLDALHRLKITTNAVKVGFAQRSPI
jgi:hypothetical protein